MDTSSMNQSPQTEDSNPVEKNETACTVVETVACPIGAAPEPECYIDERGNVLRLNEALLKRKERPTKPIFVNRRGGLGIKKFIMKHFSARGKNWKLILKAFKILAGGSVLMKKPGLISELYKMGMNFSPDESSHTHGVVLNLNVDLEQKAQTTVIPMDLAKEALKRTTYIAALNRCICRDAYDCKDYPKDLACLIMSEHGRELVAKGVARPLTYEEACAQVDKAASLGLVAQALWVEVEQLIWGIPDEAMDQFMEICYAAPAAALLIGSLPMEIV